MSIEKVYLPPEQRTILNTDGTVKEVKTVNPWEIRATGKDVQQLRGIFKDSAPQMMHEGFQEWKSIGETKITRPDGSVDTVRADKEEMYRKQPGFCVHATRPTFTLNVPWEGSLKQEGIKRQRITKDYTETWYHDGRHVLEERNGQYQDS
jgi:hypothetical protein